MSYGVREYGTREYGDGMRVITDPPAGGGPPSGAIAGTSALTFSETATLGTSLRVSDTLTFTGSGTVVGGVLLVAAPADTNPSGKLTFGGYGRLVAEVPVVAPPAAVWVKRVSPTMPAPALDARGRPT